MSETNGPDGTRDVTLALDYVAPAGAVLPSLADVRLQVQGAQIVQIGLGPALTTAQKALLENPDTGQPFRQLADGTWQLLVTSTGGADIAAGRWLFIRLKIASPSGEFVEPAVVSLVQREGLFAPDAADEALWGTPYGTPVVVWPKGVTRGR